MAKAKGKKRYAKSVDDLKGLNLEVKANLIAKAILEGRKIEL
jgi:hypothetical protein